MQPINQSPLSYDAQEHLSVMLELCDEIRAATTALAKYRLTELREHIARQESLCLRLEHVIHGMATMRDRQQLRAISSSKVMLQVRAAHMELLGLSRRFASLLRRSSRTAGLLRVHYCTFLGGPETDRSQLASQRRWTAEV